MLSLNPLDSLFELKLGLEETDEASPNLAVELSG
jgi:hypothetical protein